MRSLKGGNIMSGVAESLIKTLLDQFKTIAKTETIIGKEFQIGDFTLIPISRVFLGIGAGGGSGGTQTEAQGEGGGGGGGIRIEPIAFIVIKGDEVSFHGIKKGSAMETFLDKAPEMAERLLKKRGEKTKEEKEKAG
jgi:uncharacterized spore protein YtfJ